MKQVIRHTVGMIAFLSYMVSFSMAQAQPTNKPQSSNGNIELRHCDTDSDCIIVAYSHCCGQSKLAINEKYKSWYDSHPEAQRFNDSKECALIGMCPPDNDVNSARCDQGICALVYPKS